MENLGLEKIHNLPVYKCEASRDLSVMKGLDCHEEKVKFKSHCRRKGTCEKLSVKIKRERSQSQFRLWLKGDQGLGISTDHRRRMSLWEKVVTLHKRQTKTSEVQSVSEKGQGREGAGSRKRRMTQAGYFTPNECLTFLVNKMENWRSWGFQVNSTALSWQTSGSQQTVILFPSP